jgi:hypothetical protein
MWKGRKGPRKPERTADMATITGLLGSLTHWLVLASQWFHDWDITLLTSALIVLVVIAGVDRSGGYGPTTVDATCMGNRDRRRRTDRGCDHLDHRHPLSAGLRHERPDTKHTPARTIDGDCVGSSGGGDADDHRGDLSVRHIFRLSERKTCHGFPHVLKYQCMMIEHHGTVSGI